jgi:dTDP-4-dehydrorhamnose 3,5-epimerase
MRVEPTAIPEVKIIWPRKFSDNRGFFSETYNRQSFQEAGIDAVFAQDNHSLSADQGTVRGLHYQRDPFAQAKLVRVTKGAILDIAVDVRHGSPSFGRHVAVELSAESWSQIYIPVGFAHGFVTLAPDTEVIYKVTALYSREHEVGIIWNDPDLAIDWPVTPEKAVLSAKDAVLPRLKELPQHFHWRSGA